MADLQSAVLPHLPEWAKELDGDTNVPCAEGQDTIDFDNDDWVLLRDSYNDELNLTLHFSHRRCAELAWSKAHILPRRPDPKAPSEIPYESLEVIVARIQSMLWYDEEDKVWDRHLEWSYGANDMIESVAQLLIDEGLAPDA